MSEPILPLRQWPSGIHQARVPANDNALRLEALSRPCLGVANDASGSDADGDVWIVGDTPAGAFASFTENDIALYQNASWYAWAPVDGLRLVVNDVRKVYVGESTNEWQDDTSDGIPDAPSDGTGYVRKDGAWAAESGGGGGNRFVNIALSDMTTDITTGTAVAVWFVPEDGELVSAYIGVNDPSSSGGVGVDMENGTGTMFTTPPEIDATEYTSLTGTGAVINVINDTLTRGDRITFDILSAGTDAKGLQICIEYAPA